MNVANLENCKRLYEVSGWLTEKYYWSQGSIKNYPVEDYRVDKLLDYKPLWFDNPEENDGFVFPAYDLGYLLRKLPRDIDFGHADIVFLNIEPAPTNRTEWKIGYVDDASIYRQGFKYYADIPEDAAAKLAIALFEAGILKKEGGL